MVELSEESEGASVIGSKISAFGYQNGAVVIKLDDGRYLIIGSDSEVWYRFDGGTLQ